MPLDYKYQTKSIVQGLVKCVEEAYQNSIDEHVRTNGEWAKNITINIDPVSGLVEVQDDGRGIPVEKIGNNYRPVSAWTKLRAGSNFNDESRFGAGQNGVGISLANIFSTKFI
jgi:DNA gyrase/topoisomerase IV subunit B